MKKVLFASTALVLTAGVASADITFSGSANMGLDYGVTTVDETTVKNEIDFDIKGSGETDGGLAFGASLDLDGTSTTDTVDAGSTFAASVSDPEVFVSINGLTLTVGNVGEASYQGGLSDVGFDGIGLDDRAEVNAFGTHDVNVSYAFGDVSVAVSMDSSSDDWGIGGSASFDAFTVAVGLGETNGVDQSQITLGYSAGAFGGKVFFAENGAVNGQGVEVSYTSGDVTVTGVWADRDGAGDQSGYGIGVAYDLGGATLAGGIGEDRGNTVADLGISFSF